MATKLKTAANAVTQPQPQPQPQPQRKRNAQRQADYRARHLKDVNGKLDRVSVLVDFHAKRALERLACCYGVTQRAMLEHLVIQANYVAQREAQAQSPNGQAEYFDGQIRLPLPGVTR